MGQKIHPVGLRLGIAKIYRSQWFAITSLYPNLVIEDYFIRNQLFQKLPSGSLAKIEIQRKIDDQINLLLFSPKPISILTSCQNVKINFDQTPNWTKI